MIDSRLVARSGAGALDGAIRALDAIPQFAASARLIASGTTQVHRDRNTLGAAIQKNSVRGAGHARAPYLHEMGTREESLPKER
jgi:hypothetical protein